MPIPSKSSTDVIDCVTALITIVPIAERQCDEYDEICRLQPLSSSLDPACGKRCSSVEVPVRANEGSPALVATLWTHPEANDVWLVNRRREYFGCEIASFLGGESTSVVYDNVLADGDVSAVAGALAVEAAKQREAKTATGG